MNSQADERPEIVLGITTAAAATVAVSRSGGTGVLDLGAGDAKARMTLANAVAGARAIGIRVPAGCGLTVDDVAEVLGEHTDRVDIVVLAWDAPWQVDDIPDRCCVLIEVTSLAEARHAADLGADGVVARGNEAGGRVGELGSFVLLQHLLAGSTLPVWLCGGIGEHTAAAALTGGAAGVVLDTQLALLPEAAPDDELRAAIAGSDGTDTTVSANGSALTRTLRRHGSAPVPVGQDACLATRFVERFGTVSRSVRAVLAAIRDRRTAAPVLAAGTRLARRLGTELPVAQGPMTRVSDQAAFAAEVAEHGGLPFVALALASGATARELIEATADALGERPWGVGVLGFAPRELREAQLLAIQELRPPAALIAGGRPDQAKAFEEAGIATFLHVPSPVLLAQFLAAGARKFVFEGAECGGHVGPRTSFSLWECQIGVLEEFIASGGRAEELQLLFAGGVHDTRSAAMVAALAEPLARRGAGVGVLMGTAYLCTEEAVAHGAVGPVFQRRVLAAERTELLETAPGHATRCVPSPFTETFAATATELREQGLPERDRWERLEQLNVGRLRVASKGLRRDGADLVDVDEPTQLADGLFMAGQVALLRSTTTTISRLHTEVTSGATEFRTRRAAELGAMLGHDEPAPTREPLDVAVVGMAGMFPGAPDLASYWANIVGNVDSITEVPPRRWDTGTYYAQKPDDTSKTPSKWGGFLPEIPFDALRYGIPPTTLAAIEPVQLLALEAARRALADAGYADGGFDRARTAVVFGAEAYSDLANATNLRVTLPAYLGELPAELDARLPRLTEDSFPGRLTNVIAGRIANRLDLGGASFAVDAACGSSLAAVDAACKELETGAAELVLCGGADLHNAIEDYLLFASVGALSPTGSCKTFDSSADGIALGEAVACVVLKRLADAERDGDQIYAVIKGVGSGSDGRALGLTAPNAAGQRRALERAYDNAGVSPAKVGLVEAHGTGTVVGDRTELTTLTELFSEAGATPGGCVLGSVKSQIGHTKCAAGLAGLIKSVLAVHTGTLPPTAHVSSPNPAWRPGESPFAFRATAAPWLAEPVDRFAGISAFGFGGTNFHVVISGHGSAEHTGHGLRQWPAELFTFRGGDVRARLVELRDRIGAGATLRDLAKTVAVQSNRDRGPVRIAIVARDVDELADQVRAAIAGAAAGGVYLAPDTVDGGRLAVLFPGQGSQRPGMLAELLVAFPELRRVVAPAGAAAEAMFPPAAFDEPTRAGSVDRLRDTRLAQPALGVAGLAVHHLLTRLGIRADAYAGHSYGELVALAAAGAIDHRTLLALSTARADAILAAAGADPGGMAAVSATPEEVERALAGLGDQVVIANRNAPRQVVISGPIAPLEAAVAAVRAAGLSANPLPVACAFHSPVVAPAGAAFAKTLAVSRIRPPERPVWANRTARRYPTAPEEIREELAAQLAAPVRFADQIEAMYADGVRIFVEAGPWSVLSGLVGKILGDRPHTVTGVESQDATGVTGLLHAVALLAVAGVELSTAWLFDGRDAVELADRPPRSPQWIVDGHSARTAAGEVLPGGLAPAERVTPNLAGTGATRDDTIAEFLRNSREFIAAQRDIMLGYLGARENVESAAPRVERPAVAVQEAPEREPADSPLAVVVDVIARRTGYPAAMIEPRLDLEADLSVDSIKRTEIAGELVARLGQRQDRVDELVKARTAADLAALLDATPASPNRTEPILAPAGVAPVRYLIDPVDSSDGHVDPVALVGAMIVVAGGDPALAEEVANQLSARGAVPIVVPGAPVIDADAGPVHGLISLHAMAEPVEPPVLPGTFPMFQSVLARSPKWCVAVAPAGEPGGRGAGLRGLFRTLRREYPDSLARLVEVDVAAEAEAIAGAVVAELQTSAGEPVVTVGEIRRGIRMMPAPLATTAPADAAALGLTSDSVALLIGGARGITAQVASALARTARCRIELAGRTVLPDRPEPPNLAAATDLASLRGALAEPGDLAPGEVDRRAQDILAGREVTATLTELGALGATATYQNVDVRDTATMRRLVKQVHAEHGRIDGVVFAAGVIADKLVADKDLASFERVYGTKVDGVAGLLDELADLPELPGFVVLFGSIAAVLGNAGQADYAAANDAMDGLASAWAASTGCRALTVHWGPWAPGGEHGGMVSAGLARSYAARGIALIDPREGVSALLRELAWGDPALRSVVYAASGW